MKQTPLGRLIGSSAQQIFETGRGVLSLAEREGGKLFSTVSAVGQVFQHGVRKQFDAAGDATSHVFGSATGTVEKIERLIELRVARILNSMQIPTAHDVQQLSQRVEELNAAVERLTQASSGDTSPPPATATRSRERAPAKKRATAKKASATKKADVRKKKTTARTTKPAARQKKTDASGS